MGTFFLLDSRVSNLRTHRRPIIEAAVRCGHVVHATTLVRGKLEELDGLPINYHAIGPAVRAGGLRELMLVKNLRSLIRELKPDICHFVSLRSVLYGLLAASKQDIRLCVSSITGLGFLFIDDSLSSRAKRSVVGSLIRSYSKPQRHVLIFQNTEDRDIFVSARWAKHSSCAIIPGSGVDTKQFSESELPKSPVVVLFPSRYLTHKGIREFVGAARIVRLKRRNIEFRMVGGVDPSNPASVNQSYIDSVVSEGVVTDLGYQENMPSVLRDSTIICLPSYREGLPKALIEGAAAGRPLVATDVTGCRDVVRPGVNGALAKPGSAEDLATAICEVLDGPIDVLGRRSRKIAVNEYCSIGISKQFEGLYQGSGDPV